MSDDHGTWREDPDPAYETGDEVGQLVEPDASTEDHEEQQIADAEPREHAREDLDAEEAAMHIEPD